MNKPSMVLKVISALFLSALMAACGSSIPNEVLEAHMLSKSKKMDQGYVVDKWEVTNEYSQDIESEEYTVIEYAITYYLSDEDVAKFEAKGFKEYFGRDIYAPQLAEGRLFFIQRGSKWYSSHQNL